MADKDTIEYVWPGIKLKIRAWRSRYYAPPYLNMDDVEQESYIALVKAYSTWVKDQRISFEKYASFKVLYLLEDKFRIYRKDRNKACNNIYPELIKRVKDYEGVEFNLVESDCINIQGDLTESLYDNIDLNILMEVLDEQKLFLIRENHLNRVPLWVLGCIFGLSESRVSQIVAAGLEDMADYSKGEFIARQGSRKPKALKTAKVSEKALEVVRILAKFNKMPVKTLTDLILNKTGQYQQSKLVQECSYLIEENCLLFFKKGRDNFLQLNRHPNSRE